jgi:pimeloyl-ACP methyl ester carboxylesterase
MKIILLILSAGALVFAVIVYKNMGRKDDMQEPSHKIVKFNGVSLWTENFGDQSKPAILLISGAMASARFWTDAFCQQLADAGYFVIRYDHRDMGWSSAIDYAQHPYSLNDLAKDALAILDAYGIKKAHIVGHSMGGAVAQLMALDYPERVLSITPISSAVLTNAHMTEQEQEMMQKTWQELAKNKSTQHYAESVDGFMRSYEFLHGSVAMDKELARNFIHDMYERSTPEHIAWFAKYSAGTEPLHNHVKAQQNIPDRANDLKKVKVPVLVIHGQEDRLALVRVVQDYLVNMISHAKAHIILGMGHMIFNKELFATIANQIIEFVRGVSVERSRIIETERLYLRVPIEEDVDALMTVFADPEVMKYSPTGCLSKEQIKEKIKEWQQEYAKNNFCPFVVIRKQDDALIGICGLHISSTYTIEEKHPTEITFRLAKKFWKIGYGFEAAQAVLEYAQYNLKLKGIVAIVDVLNEDSRKLVEKIGMQRWKRAVLLGINVGLYRY